MRTLIISDVHIGNERFENEKVIEMLKIEKFDRLILNGDFVDLWVASPKEILEDKLFKYVYNISNSINVIWITGNHDHDISCLNVSRNFYIAKSYRLEENGNTFFVVHGNQSYFLKNMGWYSKWGARLNNMLYKKFGWNIQGFLSNTWMNERHVRRRREQLLDMYYREADTVIVGHSHHVGNSGKANTVLHDIGSVVLTNSYAKIENGNICLCSYR